MQTYPPHAQAAVNAPCNAQALAHAKAAGACLVFVNALGVLRGYVTKSSGKVMFCPVAIDPNTHADTKSTTVEGAIPFALHYLSFLA